MSSTTTKGTSEIVATNENPIKGIEVNSEVSVKGALPRQEEVSNSVADLTTEKIESVKVPESIKTGTKKKDAATSNSKPKKVEAAAIKPQTQKAEVATAKSKKTKTDAVASKSTPKKAEPVATKSNDKKAETRTAKTKKVELAAVKAEKVAQKVAVGKSVGVNTTKIKLAASTYHYYRNWLAEFMRSHGVPSAKFQKSPESYNGHIVVVEAEKAKGIKALDQWSKQNPDTKDLFWDVKK